MELIARPVFFPEVTIQGRTEGPVVDTRCEHPGGRIYIDRLEASEIAHHFGFAVPDEVARLRTQLEQARGRVAELEAKLQRLGQLVSEEALSV
jgi:hypothetical protein